MTSDTLSAIAGALLSLAAAYLPGFSGWFGALSPVSKRAVMAGLLALAAGGSLALGCTGWAAAWGAGEAACDAPTALRLAHVFVMALAANQATFQLAVARTPRPEDFDYMAAVERLLAAPPAQPADRERDA